MPTFQKNTRFLREKVGIIITKSVSRETPPHLRVKYSLIIEVDLINRNTPAFAGKQR